MHSALRPCRRRAGRGHRSLRWHKMACYCSSFFLAYSFKLSTFPQKPKPKSCHTLPITVFNNRHWILCLQASEVLPDPPALLPLSLRLPKTEPNSSTCRRSSTNRCVTLGTRTQRIRGGICSSGIPGWGCRVTQTSSWSFTYHFKNLSKYVLE